MSAQELQKVIQKLRKWWLNRTPFINISSHRSKNSDRGRIAILYTIHSSSDELEIQSIAHKKEKEGYKVSTLWITPKKDSSEENILGKKDINWLEKPIGGKIESFLKSPYEVIYCLSSEFCITEEYILRSINAKIKVGIHSTKNLKYLDICTDTSSTSMKEIVRQLDQLLAKINSNG